MVNHPSEYHPDMCPPLFLYGPSNLHLNNKIIPMRVVYFIFYPTAWSDQRKKQDYMVVKAQL